MMGLRDWINGVKAALSPGKNRPDGADKVQTDPSKDPQPASGDNTKGKN